MVHFLWKIMYSLTIGRNNEQNCKILAPWWGWGLTSHFRDICWRRHKVIIHFLWKIVYSLFLPNDWTQQGLEML